MAAIYFVSTTATVLVGGHTDHSSMAAAASRFYAFDPTGTAIPVGHVHCIMPTTTTTTTLSSMTADYCSYHGVAETDLINLTSCFGYELWRFSTTCTLVLESVKATGIILLLGVGSFVCYRLYRRYYRRRRRRRRSSSSSLSSSWTDHNDNSSSSSSPSLSTSDSDNKIGWWPLLRQGHRRRRSSPPPAHVVSWLSTRELIDTLIDSSSSEDLCNIQLKHSMRFQREYFEPDDRADSRRGRRRRISSTASNHISGHQNWTLRVVNRHESMGQCNTHIKSRAPESDKPVFYDVRKGVQLPVQSTSPPETILASRRKRPNTLPLRCRQNAQPHSSTLLKQRKGSEGDSEESDEDVKEYFTSGSMMANYSPVSLMNRRVRNATFIVHSPSSASMTSPSTSSSLEETRYTLDDVFSVNKSGCGGSLLQRDVSFGSELSEISFDTSVFNDIGIHTRAKMDDIQVEIDNVKRDFELYIKNNNINVINANGPTPTVYTELVNRSVNSESSLSSDHDGEDVIVGDDDDDGRICVNPSSSQDDDLHKMEHDHISSATERRASFRQTRNSNSVTPPSMTGNQSLEWDSMKCNSSGGSMEMDSIISTSAIELRRRLIQSSSGPAVVTAPDSGSEFGTPLTSNGSPELTSISTATRRSKRFGSVASLEWDDHEFEITDRPSNCNVIEEGVSSATFGLLNTVTSSSSVDRKMWSSIESGYVEEFSSSQVSPQENSLTNNKDEKVSIVQQSVMVQPVHDQMIDLKLVVGPRIATTKAFGQMSARVRKEFFTACKHLDFSYARIVQGDQYCALRAVLIQALAQGFPVLEYSGGADQIKKKLSTWMRSRHRSWIRKCNFGGRIAHVTRDNCLTIMLDCIQSLEWLMSCVLSSQNRERVVIDTLNSDAELDVKVMEGLKLVLLSSAIDLYEMAITERPFPGFAEQLFKRETSLTPEAFLVNHLNSVGHTCGLGQMELHILGYSLGVTLCILNPSKGSRERDEFIAYYPDYDLGSRPEIYLASVDGQQFSIVVK